MKIGELSRLSGVSPSTLRYYELERLMPPVPRRGGQREYDERSAAILAVVRLARQAGFTVGEVRQLLGEFGRNRWRRLAVRKIEEIRETTLRLLEMRGLLEKLLRCECPDLDFCGRQIKARPDPGRPVATRRPPQGKRNEPRKRPERS